MNDTPEPIDDEVEHGLVVFNFRTICICGDFNCASLD